MFIHFRHFNSSETLAPVERFTDLVGGTVFVGHGHIILQTDVRTVSFGHSHVNEYRLMDRRKDTSTSIYGQMHGHTNLRRPVDSLNRSESLSKIASKSERNWRLELGTQEEQRMEEGVHDSPGSIQVRSKNKE